MVEEEFLAKLKKLVESAKAKNSMIEFTELDKFCKEINLTGEQMDLVYQYLEDNKIVVQPTDLEPEDEVIKQAELFSSDELLLEPTDEELEEEDEEKIDLDAIDLLDGGDQVAVFDQRADIEIEPVQGSDPGAERLPGQCAEFIGSGSQPLAFALRGPTVEGALYPGGYGKRTAVFAQIPGEDAHRFQRSGPGDRLLFPAGIKVPAFKDVRNSKTSHIEMRIIGDTGILVPLPGIGQDQRGRDAETAVNTQQFQRILRRTVVDFILHVPKRFCRVDVFQISVIVILGQRLHGSHPFDGIALIETIFFGLIRIAGDLLDVGGIDME